MSEKQKNSGKGQVLIQPELVKIFTAQDNVQAEMIIQTLKEHGIPNIKEDLGNAGIMNLYGGNSKFGEIIYVRKEDVKNAEKVLTEIGLHS